MQINRVSSSSNFNARWDKTLSSTIAYFKSNPHIAPKVLAKLDEIEKMFPNSKIINEDAFISLKTGNEKLIIYTKPFDFQNKRYFGMDVPAFDLIYETLTRLNKKI